MPTISEPRQEACRYQGVGHPDRQQGVHQVGEGHQVRSRGNEFK